MYVGIFLRFRHLRIAFCLRERFAHFCSEGCKTVKAQKLQIMFRDRTCTTDVQKCLGKICLNTK